jgi:hypothetical protein
MINAQQSSGQKNTPQSFVGLGGAFSTPKSSLKKSTYILNESENHHPLKWQRMLSLFLDGHTLNWQIGRDIGTSCLNSDVADLQDRGVIINRHWVRLSGYRGLKTRGKNYTLDNAPENLALARSLLGIKSPT